MPGKGRASSSPPSKTRHEDTSLSYHDMRRFPKTHGSKKLFPAGFMVNQSRGELVIDTTFASLTNKLPALRPLPGPTFASWTRGSCGENSTIDSMVDEDPFADCAGPSLHELVALRQAAAKSQPLIQEDPACLVSRCKIYFDKKDRKPSQSVLTMEKKLSAPSLLPAFKPSLNRPGVTAAYEKWLAEKRMRLDEQAWHAKGNNLEENYSSFVFDGSKQLTVGLAAGGSVATTAAMSVALPRNLPLEIHTFNQLLHSRSALDHGAHYSYKVVPSSITLVALKIEIVQDIVRSIQHAFAGGQQLQQAMAMSLAHAPSGSDTDSFRSDLVADVVVGDGSSFDSLSVNTMQSFATDISIQAAQIDLLLQFYHPGLHAWRPLQQEQDWILAMHTFIFYVQDNQQTPLQLTYALEPKSEEQLLREIEQFYEQRRSALSQLHEHISVQALTDALEHGRKQPKVPGGTRTISSVGTHVSTSVSQGAGSSQLFTSNSSILYPKPCAKLQELTRAGKEEQNKLEKHAQQLEQKILKTKW